MFIALHVAHCLVTCTARTTLLLVWLQVEAKLARSHRCLPTGVAGASRRERDKIFDQPACSSSLSNVISQ